MADETIKPSEDKTPITPSESPISPPSSYFPPTSETEMQKPAGNFIKIIVGVIVFAVVGIGACLLIRVWDPFWNPFRPSPEKVIEAMRSKMAEAKTVHTDAKILLQTQRKESTTEKTQEINFTINYIGDSDVSDSNNPKMAGDLEIVMETDGTEFSLGIGFETIDKVAYFRLTKIPFLTFFPLQFISTLKNQWIKVDEESFKALMGEYYTSEIEQQWEESKKQQAELKEELEKIIKGRKLFNVKKKLPDEKAGDKKAYCYLIALNKEELKSVIIELLEKIFSKKIESSGLYIEEFKKGRAEFEKGLSEFFDKIGEITAEVWIGQRDNFLYKIITEKEIDLRVFEKKTEGTMNIKTEISFSNFNQPVKIEAPKEFKGLEEIFGSFIMPF